MTTRIPPAHDRRKWSPRDDAVLLRAWELHDPWVVAALLTRSVRACRARLKELKEAENSDHE